MQVSCGKTMATFRSKSDGWIPFFDGKGFFFSSSSVFFSRFGSTRVGNPGPAFRTDVEPKEILQKKEEELISSQITAEIDVKGFQEFFQGDSGSGRSRTRRKSLHAPLRGGGFFLDVVNSGGKAS